MCLLLVLYLFPRERGTELASAVEVESSLQAFVGERLVLELDRSILWLNDLMDHRVLVESLSVLVVIALGVDPLVPFEIILFEEVVLLLLLEGLAQGFFY